MNVRGTTGTPRTNPPDKGFSLIELMVTVTILAIIASIALPSIQTGFQQQSIVSATNEVMHLVDFARIQAVTRNKAYELRIKQSDGDNGSLEVNESANTRCDGFAAGIPRIRTLSFNGGEHPDIRIVSTAPTGLGASYQLCFKPSGRVVRSDTSKPLPAIATGYGAGEGHIVLQRLNTDGKTLGPKHRIIVPYNGLPRFEPGS